MEKERTKGPWVLDGHNLSAVIRCTVPRGHPDAKHLTGDYETIARCDGDNWKANAAFIVRAANSHEELVAFVSMIARFQETTDADDSLEVVNNLIGKARALVKLATA